MLEKIIEMMAFIVAILSSKTFLSTVAGAIISGFVIFKIQMKKHQQELRSLEKQKLLVYLSLLKNMFDNYSGCLTSYKKLKEGFQLQNNVSKVNAFYVYDDLDFIGSISSPFYVHIVQLGTNINICKEKISLFRETKHAPYIIQAGRQFLINCMQLQAQIISTTNYLGIYYGLDDALNENELKEFKKKIMEVAEWLLEHNRGPNSTVSEDDENMIKNLKEMDSYWVIKFK